jgi:hypothetical protein
VLTIAIVASIRADSSEEDDDDSVEHEIAAHDKQH